MEENFSFPVKQSNNGEANALTRDLNSAKHTVESTQAEVNPLKRDLDQPKHQAVDMPEVEITEEQPEVEVESTGKSTQSNAGASSSKTQASPGNGGGGTYQKPLGNHAKTAEWVLKGWDQLASRVLRHIAKDEFRDRWSLTKKEHEDLMEWCTECTTYYNVTVDSSMYGMMYSLFIIYSDKGLDAREARKQNEKIAQQEEELKYWRNVKGDAGDTATTREIDELLSRIRNGKKARPQDTSERTQTTQTRGPKVKTATHGKVYPDVEDVEVIEEDDDFEEEQQQREWEELERAKMKRQHEENARRTVADEFNLQSQIDREFHTQHAENWRSSTGEAVENTISGQKLNGTDNKFNTQTAKKPTVETGFTTVEGSDNIARNAEGKLEPFEPMKEDKRGRETEVVRCPQTHKLFERFVGKDKIFINNDAKSQYYYWLKLKAQGKEPKGGFPPWWNSG